MAPRDFLSRQPVLEDSARPITSGTREFSISEAQVVELALWLRKLRFRGEGWLGVAHDAPASLNPTSFVSMLVSPSRRRSRELARLREYRPVWLPIVEAHHAQKIDDVHTLLQPDIHVPLPEITRTSCSTHRT